MARQNQTAEFTFLPITARSVIDQSISFALLMAVVWFGQFDFLVLQVLIAAEMLAVGLVSTVINRERPLSEQVFGLLGALAFLVFILFFAVLAYASLSDDAPSLIDLASRTLAAFAGGTLVWSLAYLVARVLAIGIRALRSPDPKLSWGRAVLQQFIVNMFTLFVLVFVVISLAKPLITGVHSFETGASTDAILGTLAGIVRAVLGLLVARLPMDDLLTKARQASSS
jgi:hypothetical protein